MIIIEQAKQELASLKKQLESLGEALDIANLEKQRAELAKQQEADGFWENLENAQKVNKEVSRIEGKIDRYRKLCSKADDIEVLIELCLESETDSESEEIQSELTELAKEIEQTTLETLLKGKYDANNAIMTLHAGAGGTEAQDWALILYRMYGRWADAHNFKIKVLDYIGGEEAGMKSADILVEGENAFGYLKSEMGVHRLIRVSPFDTSGRRHTSFAAIEVMPEITEDVDIEIKDEDLKVDTYRSGGAGGQHVNKTESAIRITHIPTGIIVACQNERSQHQNREVAMRMLKSKLMEIKEREHLDKIEDIKGVQKKIEWGSQIRSYVFMPYTLVKDHRTGYENTNVNAVIDGDIDGFINAYLKASATGNWAKK